MQPAKQEALDKIRKSQEAADQGGFARSEDLKREIDTW